MAVIAPVRASFATVPEARVLTPDPPVIEHRTSRPRASGTTTVTG